MSRHPTTPDPPAQASAWDALRRPIWMFDPVALRGVYANPSALALWGAQSLHELLSRDFSKLSPAVRARTDRLAKATASGEDVTEQWTFYPAGKPVTVLATISTFKLADGAPVLLFEASSLEVEATERRAVEALRHASTLITLFGADGRPRFANPAVFACYGAEEQPFAARFVDFGQGQAMFEAALSGQTAVEVCEIETGQGRRWHHLDARPVTDPVTGAIGVLLNERDVTERVEAEAGRAAAEQKAAMAEARQRFLSEMSHELRTPLNAVIGFSELLAASALGESATRHAEHIHAAGQRLSAVVNEMIRLSEGGELSTDLSAGDEAQGPAASVADETDERTLRVLCVDDNSRNRDLITAVLTAQGVECQTANDGAEALAAVAAGRFDLVLMDIQMPVMNGVEATRAIRALKQDQSRVPIVAVTANTLADQLAEYAQAGINDCIGKPFALADLLGKVAQWTDIANDAGPLTLSA